MLVNQQLKGTPREILKCKGTFKGTRKRNYAALQRMDFNQILMDVRLGKVSSPDPFNPKPSTLNLRPQDPLAPKVRGFERLRDLRV